MRNLVIYSHHLIKITDIDFITFEGCGNIHTVSSYCQTKDVWCRVLCASLLDCKSIIPLLLRIVIVVCIIVLSFYPPFSFDDDVYILRSHSTALKVCVWIIGNFCVY